MYGGCLGDFCFKSTLENWVFLVLFHGKGHCFCWQVDLFQEAAAKDLVVLESYIGDLMWKFYVLNHHFLSHHFQKNWCFTFVLYSKNYIFIMISENSKSSHFLVNLCPVAGGLANERISLVIYGLSETSVCLAFCVTFLKNWTVYSTFWFSNYFTYIICSS